MNAESTISGNNYDIYDKSALIERIKVLETELAEYKAWTKQLLSEIKRRPPLEKKGSKNNASWHIKLHEKKNILFIKLSGSYTYSIAKSVSMTVLNVLPFTRPGFATLLDVTEFNPNVERRVSFQFRKIMYYCKLMEIKMALRITTPENIAAADFFSGEMEKLKKESRYNSKVFHSLEDAVNYLKKSA